MFIKWKMSKRGAGLAPTCVSAPLIVHGKLANLNVGEFSSLGRIYIQAYERVSIGRCVVISDGVKLITGGHDVNSPSYEFECGPIIVQDYAWVAMNVIVLKDITIGKGAIVGAGSVVTRNVEPYSIVAGNPARIIGRRDEIRFTYLPATWFGAVVAWVGRNPPIDMESIKLGK
jgi:maltose O-acetyltransferase